MNTEQLKAAAMAAEITAHSVQEVRTGKYAAVEIEVPAATILALLECVDALRLAVRQNDHDMLMTGDELRQCRAALQKLEAL